MVKILHLFCVHQIFANFVTSDLYAAVFVSNFLNFGNISYTGINETSNYPLRLTDGLYGIGAWSEKVELETIFIGYEDDSTLDFTSWIASSGSLGCNASHYSHVGDLKKDNNSDHYIGIFTYPIIRS